MFIKVRTTEELKEILDIIYRLQKKFPWYSDFIKDIFWDDPDIEEDLDILEPKIEALKSTGETNNYNFDSFEVDEAALNSEISSVLDKVKLPVYMNIAELGTTKTSTVYVDVFHEDEIVIDDLEDTCQQICDIFELGSNQFSG